MENIFTEKELNKIERTRKEEERIKKIQEDKERAEFERLRNKYGEV
jgi:Na+/phosphate symporter